MTTILDGKKLAKDIKEKIKTWIKEDNVVPKLAILSFGDDEASKVYMKNKLAAAAEVGMEAKQFHFTKEQYEADKFFSTLDTIIGAYHGVILQLPVPFWCDSREILNHIPVEKDVDGLTDTSIGQLRTKPFTALTPCTPSGIAELLLEYYSSEELTGKHAVIVGRSNLVGKPLAELLLMLDMTVTVCHSKTKDLAKHTKDADILVAAVGKKHLITADMVKEGAIVIDVGINRENGKLYGDVDYENVAPKCSAITPVPGGVGPMTVVMLLWNTYDATRLQTLN